MAYLYRENNKKEIGKKSKSTPNKSNKEMPPGMIGIYVPTMEEWNKMSPEAQLNVGRLADR